MTGQEAEGAPRQNEPQTPSGVGSQAGVPLTQAADQPRENVPDALHENPADPLRENLPDPLRGNVPDPPRENVAHAPGKLVAEPPQPSEPPREVEQPPPQAAMQPPQRATQPPGDAGGPLQPSAQGPRQAEQSPPDVSELPPSIGQFLQPVEQRPQEAQPDKGREQLQSAEQAAKHVEHGGHPVGMGEVLDHVRQPQELRRPPVVLFEKVTKTYNVGTPKEYTAIRDVSFVVEDLPAKGEFICVLGPSGCGKSTILRLIAGLEPQHPPTRGRVQVMGRPVTRPGADRGMVFQDYTSFDNRTVLDNVVFGLECLGMPRRERYELGRYWIERVGLNLAKDQYKYPHELSGGMRQRVAIARTLVLRPRIILMDEPFGALDPQTRLNMQDLLVALWHEVQATVFFVTHSIEEAVFLGDRVYIMSNAPGTILEELEVDPADRPSHLMQKEPKFQETVFYLRDRLAKLEQQA